MVGEEERKNSRKKGIRRNRVRDKKRKMKERKGKGVMKIKKKLKRMGKLGRGKRVKRPTALP